MRQHLTFIAFFIFLIASFFITYPLIFHLKDYASGEYVIAWILNWDIHSILRGNILNIFSANIFYPFKYSLAYSDFLFPSSLLALPFFLLLREPIVPSNITFITSLTFLGFFTYLLSFYLTKNFWLSILAGVLVVFNPLIIDKRVHLRFCLLNLYHCPFCFLLNI